MPDVQTLRCFLAAARARTFREASRAVALSPAAFGQRIRQLEEELEVELFHRTTRSLTLSQAGLDLVAPAQRALTAFDECVRAAHGELGHAPTELELGTRHELGLSWIVPQIPRLEAEHPGLTLHLYFGSGTDLVLRVRAGELDCAVTSTRLTDPKVDAVPLHEEGYVFVGQPRLLRDHPLTEPHDAHEHTLLDTTAALPLFRYWRDAAGGFDSMEFSQVLRLGTIAAIRYFVLRGRGVAVLPAYYVAGDIARGKLVRVLPEVDALSDQFRLVFRAGDPRRGLLHSLAATLRLTPLS